MLFSVLRANRKQCIELYKNVGTITKIERD